MQYLQSLISDFCEAVKKLYDYDVDPQKLIVNHTRKEFSGDFTIVLFPYVKDLKTKPEVLGEQIGEYLCQYSNLVKSSNTVKGFLNLELEYVFFADQLNQIHSNAQYGTVSRDDSKTIMIESSSPNTNKPLHLGHVRNILLGWACAKIYETLGYKVIKTQVINDRGIAICKSMLSWQKFGNGTTPESTGIKADHFVGDYYVLFEKKFQEEYSLYQQSSEAEDIYTRNSKEGQDRATFFKAWKNQYFNNYSLLGAEAREMLRKWEARDTETVALWEKMNNWVYQGFDATYDRLGVSYDKLYYESDTYLLGKDAVEKGLQTGVFYQEPDGSVWIDLTDAGMDKKVVLRSDGTSVYITQDIGTAMLRYKDFGIERMVYVVADEQDYHFKVLFEICKRLKESYAEGMYHLSYGMVDLPDGAKMKSREGTTVDADNLLDEVIREATATAMERGEIAQLGKDEQQENIRKIGLAALKYFLLRVSARKRMTFDPKESVDMQGQTGPYIQNAYVRIKSIFRKKDDHKSLVVPMHYEINDMERELVKLLLVWPETVATAANDYDPAVIANYCYNLAKEFHRFYHENRILNADTEHAKSFRLVLIHEVAKVLEKGMDLMGIEMVDKM
jgi:arginyl-tRNA synthetase